jgi:hypothetical protein
MRPCSSGRSKYLLTSERECGIGINSRVATYALPGWPASYGPGPRGLGPPAPNIIGARMDHTSLDGALALASRIREYWAERGYEVETYVDSLQYRHGEAGIIHTVRTDMIGGLPQRQREQKAA